MRRRGFAEVLLAGVLLVGCGSGDDPPVSEGPLVPVVDPASGDVVGQVPQDDLDRVARDGGRAEVTDDGEVVGYVTPDGFVPDAETDDGGGTGP